MTAWLRDRIGNFRTTIFGSITTAPQPGAGDEIQLPAVASPIRAGMEVVLTKADTLSPDAIWERRKIAPTSPAFLPKLQQSRYGRPDQRHGPEAYQLRDEM